MTALSLGMTHGLPKAPPKFLHADCVRDLRPTPVLLSLQPTQVDSGHSQAAVVQEPTHVFHRLPNVPTQLGGRVAKDMDASGRDTGQSEVPLQVAVEGATGKSLAVLRA